MSFLLDTNICSAFLRGDRNVFNRCIQHSGGLHVSTISVGELYAWTKRASTAARYAIGLQTFLHDVKVLPVDEQIAEEFGRHRATLLDAGKPTPQMDLFIASTATYFDLTLVTHNVRDFSQIAGLRFEDWVTMP